MLMGFREGSCRALLLFDVVKHGDRASAGF